MYLCSDLACIFNELGIDCFLSLGWLIKIHVPNSDEFNELLSPEEYEKFLEEEEG